MLKYALGAALVSFGFAQSAIAADVAPAPPPVSDWHVDMTLYGWAPLATGQVGVHGLGPADIDTTYSDLIDSLKNLDGVFMGTAEVRYDNWGVLGDLMWIDMTKDKTGRFGLLTATLDASALIGTGAITYSFIDTPEAHLEGLLGARYWSMNTSLSLSSGASASAGLNWVDPMIGLKGSYNISPKVYLAGTGAIGGFGVGSQFEWDATASIGYRFNNNFSASLGYRALGVNYNRDGNVIDLTLHGPVVGLTATF